MAKALVRKSRRVLLRAHGCDKERRRLQTLEQRGEVCRLSPGAYVPNHMGKEAAARPVMSWWGSKRGLVRELVNLIVSVVQKTKAPVVISPFTGGGIVEQTLQSQGIPVRASDGDPMVAAVHSTLRRASKRQLACLGFSRFLQKLKHKDAKERFKSDVKRLVGKRRLSATEVGQLLAAKKVSFREHLTKASTLMEDRVHAVNLENEMRRLREYRGFMVSCQDFERSIASAPKNAVLFIDPPYLLEKREGQYVAGDFLWEDHVRLAEALRGRHFVLTHQNDRRIAGLYDWATERIISKQIMTINRAEKLDRRELIIVNVAL